MRKLIPVVILFHLIFYPEESIGQHQELPQPPPVDLELSRLPVTSMLFYLSGELRDKSYAGQYPVEWAAKRGLALSPSGLVNVEIVTLRGEVPVPASMADAIRHNSNTNVSGSGSVTIVPGP